MKPLFQYIQDKRSHGFSDTYIKQLAVGKGYAKSEVERHFASSKPKKKKAWVFILIFAVFILAPSIFYFTYVSPVFVSKPTIEMPADLSEISSVNEDHVQYFVNELDVYKLHSDPRTKEPPIMEISLTDSDQIYSIVVAANYPVVSLGAASDPDLRLIMTSESMITLLSSEDMNTQLVSMVNSGDVQIEMIKDEVTLGLKGYKALYDAVTKGSGSPTGGVVRAFRGKVFN